MIVPEEYKSNIGKWIQSEPWYNTEIIPKEQQWGKVFSNFKKAVVRCFWLSPNQYLFTVNAGPYSEWSYSGSFYPQEFASPQDLMDAIDKRNKDKKLFL